MALMEEHFCVSLESANSKFLSRIGIWCVSANGIDAGKVWSQSVSRSAAEGLSPPKDFDIGSP